MIANKLDSHQVIAVNLGETIDRVNEFQNQKQYPFPVVIVPPKFSWKTFHVMATPTIAYVTEDGVIADFSSGLSPLAVFHSQQFLK